MTWLEPVMWIVGGTTLAAALALLGAMAERGSSTRVGADATNAPARDSGIADVVARVEQLADAVDAIAVEVERLGEGQRYVTKLLAERPQQSPQPGAIPAIKRPTA